MKPIALLGEELSAQLPALQYLCTQYQLGVLPMPIQLPAMQRTGLQAMWTLGFAGALVSGPLSESLLPICHRVSPEARYAGQIDTLTLAQQEVDGFSVLEDALYNFLREAEFRSYGARMLVIGDSSLARVAVRLARLGFSRVVWASSQVFAAERVLQQLPAGIERFAIHTRDETLASLLERTDLVIQAGEALPTRLWQPYHALLDLSDSGGQLALERQGGQVLSRELWKAHHMVAQFQQLGISGLNAEQVREAYQYYSR